jgi:glucan endo-1,3-alpha-glucosidase
MGESGECFGLGRENCKGSGRFPGWMVLILVCVANCFSVGAFGAVQHYVFAHYMVCFATYGENVQAYEREIQEAQAAGIDGFALNVGAWSGPQAYYKSRVALIYQAAEQLGTGFKLFFSIDGIEDTNDIIDMVTTYAPRTNSFRYQGRIVLSTFGQCISGNTWSGVVFPTLTQRGIDVFFVPYMFTTPPKELPAYADAVTLCNNYSNLVSGLFYFGGAGLPSQLVQCNSDYTKAVQAAGKLSMASVTPTYWGCQQTTLGRRYFEFDGGEGLIQQWSAIMTNQPDWVEIVTWNDFEESYISPVDDPGQYFSELAVPHRYSHAGYFQLSKQFINWYKTGAAPTNTQDAIYFFYRTHPKSAVASDTNDVPVTGFVGNVQDTFYATAFLTAPAILEISSGPTVTTNSLSAGMNLVRVRFSPGSQKLVLRRDGKQILSVEGPAINASIQDYDFFPESGFAVRPPPPEGLRFQN